MAEFDEESFDIVPHDVCEVLASEAGTSVETFSADREMSWHLHEFGIQQLRDKFGVSGKGAKIAVIDTGVDASHPQFQGRVVAHDCTGEGAGDVDGHGTHCCGISMAVAPGAEIHSFKVFDVSGRAVHRNIMTALAKVNAMGFHVVNMSLGSGQPSQAMMMALLELNACGTLICCAAGNEGGHDNPDAPRFGTISFPAGFNSTLAVGSVDKKRVRSPFSSSGPKISIMAPGQGVWSSWTGGGMACLSGTSMASPFMAGVLALLHEACSKRALKPLNLSEVLYAAALSCNEMEAPGFDFFTGYGCIYPQGFVERAIQIATRRIK